MNDENICLSILCPGNTYEMDVVLGESQSGRIICGREAGILDALPFDNITLGSGQLFKVSLVEDAIGQPIEDVCVMIQDCN